MRIIISCIVICTMFSCVDKHKKIILNKSFCLNNEDDAIRMAEKEWLKVYGRDIYRYKPFKARVDSDSIWVVYGSLSLNRVGGTPQAKINANTCKVIQIIHGK
ncbi:NTF2 fold immunity protein [Chryseobacterium kwangjuense]|nr:NTF2 fold immunity protein [Chryseobacterium kwangjuense]